MALTVSVNGSVRIDTPGRAEESVEPILDGIVDALECGPVKELSRSATTVSFKLKSIRWSRDSSPLNYVESGIIEILPQIDSVIIFYKLPFINTFLFMIAISIFISATVYILAPDMNLYKTLDFFALIGAILLFAFGLQYVLTLYRFPRMLKRVAQEAVADTN